MADGVVKKNEKTELKKVIIGEKPIRDYVRAVWTILFREGDDRVKIVAAGKDPIHKAVTLAGIFQDQHGCKVEGIKLITQNLKDGRKKTKLEIFVRKTPESTPEQKERLFPRIKPVSDVTPASPKGPAVKTRPSTPKMERVIR